MANEKQLDVLNKGVDAWNSWHSENPETKINLSGAKLNFINLDGINFSGANLSHASFFKTTLRRANLGGTNLQSTNFIDSDLSDSDIKNASLTFANLTQASLCGANLSGADLTSATLSGVNMIGANLSAALLYGTNLRGANLSGADFNHADISAANFSSVEFIGKEATLRLALSFGADLGKDFQSGANLSGVKLSNTIFADTDLTPVRGLDSCQHMTQSIVDHRTLERSKGVPISFWRGCGLPDHMIDQLSSIVEEGLQYYTCFISYSSQDQEFADRLHADLQDNGVRCWFATHDLPIGAKTWDGIDQAIRTRDKVLLILSEDAIASGWVEDEVTTTFAEERRRDDLMLFPIRLDSAVMDADEPWAGKLRDNRNIGDFTKWKDHDAYKMAFNRVLRDLKQER